MPTKKKKTDLEYFGGYIMKGQRRKLHVICKHRFPNLAKNWKSHLFKSMCDEFIEKYLAEAEAALAKKKEAAA